MSNNQLKKRAISESNGKPNPSSVDFELRLCQDINYIREVTEIPQMFTVRYRP